MRSTTSVTTSDGIGPGAFGTSLDAAPLARPHPLLRSHQMVNPLRTFGGSTGNNLVFALFTFVGWRQRERERQRERKREKERERERERERRMEEAEEREKRE